MAEGVSLVGKAGSMDQRDKRMAEDFMMWVVWRKEKKNRGMGVLNIGMGVSGCLYLSQSQRDS